MSVVDEITIRTATYRVTAADGDFEPFEVAVNGDEEQRSDLLLVAVESRLLAGSGVYLGDDGTGVIARTDRTSGRFTATEV